ncbi:hypothetical protein LOD99_12164 [Oopsacas minuta]|uniref:Exosome complex component CSL4 n=1 Tax=Oopsacas minuta TaxID=111878 RepID=A0AAV7JIS7_9METZ|nr:hypothetical protein LOD99_12164 [Oopsacas minuta]
MTAKDNSDNPSTNSVAIPGNKVASLTDYNPGPGTYISGNSIFASLSGFIRTEPPIVLSEADEVQLPHIHIEMHELEKKCIPQSGSLVNARVISINPRSCKVSIIAVDNTYLKHTFRGIVRKEDIRAFQKDQVEIDKCYRPGDIIRARVISLGEALHYVLTTAENELGVIFAKGGTGVPLMPYNWEEMQCPKTGNTEYRKVAKVKEIIK